MDLTAGKKATAVSAAVVMVAGLSVILYGVIYNDLARSLGGACLTMTALTLIALVAIRKWITDTSEERRVLAAAVRDTQAERTRYIAAQAALENEQGRLARDVAAERAGLAAKLIAEREAMATEFEEKRNQLVSEAMNTGVAMFLSSRREHTKAPVRGDVIQFPNQQGEPEPERVRSRGHGVVGP
ncbi:hypothetical protein ACH40E_03190 [Streptomyces acidicola]|uniref:hypothetical protein n=1 Tax=Streptomyces acidicola TaxID=2596892 RepID=UPI00378B8E93